MVDGPMWSLVMFDLPVKTKEQRKDATAFRKLLVDRGYCMVQYSVYARYLPLGGIGTSAMNEIISGLPRGGEVRGIHLTDRQWSKGVRFCNGEPARQEDEPEQLSIF